MYRDQNLAHLTVESFEIAVALIHPKYAFGKVQPFGNIARQIFDVRAFV